MKTIYTFYKVYTTCETVEEVPDEVYEELMNEAKARGEMPVFKEIELDVVGNEWDYVNKSFEIYDEDGNCVITY